MHASVCPERLVRAARAGARPIGAPYLGVLRAPRGELSCECWASKLQPRVAAGSYSFIPLGGTGAEGSLLSALMILMGFGGYASFSAVGHPQAPVGAS
eukprot:2779078-Pyramimonas_sp.AAC.2